MSQKDARAASPVAPKIDSPAIADSESPSSASPSTAFEALAALISPSHRYRFASAARLGNTMAARIQDCVSKERGCYIYVDGVGERMIDAIDNTFCNRGLTGALRLTYEATLDALIIKCMPGEEHEKTSRSFLVNLLEKIVAIPGHNRYSIIAVGSTRFSVPGVRSKEGDEGIKPRNTRAKKNQWPSLMVEVGYSENLAHLRQDAHWWLDHSHNQTRMVIIIHINSHPMSMRLERWERVVDEMQRSTRSRVPTTPGYVQYFDIDHAGNVTHHPDHPDLLIPYKCVFDTGDPVDMASDITIPKNELSEWALYVYEGLDDSDSE